MKNPESVIGPILESGENLRWSGAPGQGFRFGPQDFVLIPFSIFWGGFSLIWEGFVLYMLITTGQLMLIVMALFGVPFLVIGYFLTIGRFTFEKNDRENTCYGVTDRRVIIIRGKNNETVNSITYDAMPVVRLLENSDRTGNITFDLPPGERPNVKGNLTTLLAGDANRSFRFIGNPRDVYNLIESLRHRKNPPGEDSSFTEEVYTAPVIE